MAEVELINSAILDSPDLLEITQPISWLTPGIFMAQNIFDSSLVRFVGERYESDYLQTVVVLNDDPEELLNRVFSVEQEMFKKFGKLRFDVRVRVIPSSESIDLIKHSTVVHFERNLK